MSWWETENDDAWLTENVGTEGTNAEVPVVPEPVQSVLDLTEAASSMEPLHSLTEAPKCLIRTFCLSDSSYIPLDVDDCTSYFVFKVQSVRDLSTIQNTGIFHVPAHMKIELNTSLASSSFVVFIFSVVGTYTFDGYGLFIGTVDNKRDSNTGGYAASSRFVTVCVQFIRRGLVPFSQVAHIRDQQVLQGRPISTAKDGMRVGISAARALCRGVDKIAYREDPIHYRDMKYTPRIMHSSKVPTQSTLSKQETDFLTMSHSEYLTYISNRTDASDLVPSLARATFYK